MANTIDEADDKWANRGSSAYVRFTNHPVLWTVGVIVAIWVVGSLIANAAGIASIYWQAEQAKLTVKPRVTQQVYSTGNAISQINYFHNQCNTIVADNQQVTNDWEAVQQDKQQFDSTSDPIAQQQAGSQLSQDRTAWLGVKDQLANDVQDYDAKSATLTANPFKAHNLPYRIHVDGTTGELVGQVNCQ